MQDRANFKKITFRNVPVRTDDYAKMERAKILFERDFHRQVSWSDFFLSVVTGYALGRSILSNENKFNLLLEEEEPPETPHRPQRFPRQGRKR